MKLRKGILIITVLVFILLSVLLYFRFFPSKSVINDPKWGMAIDSFNHVLVYYNGSVSNTNGRNKAPDGYNLGLKYQCVEFVKRYYYQHLNHIMPDSYGNAKDFFDPGIKDGEKNIKRDLIQFCNPSKSKPKTDDLIIFDGHIGNSYGHVAIVCDVSDYDLTIIQQNPGSSAPSRVSIAIKQVGEKFEINNSGILGWLRKE